MENYKLTEPRYEAMNYRRCGRSGLLLPEISLGFWHNFGAEADPEKCRFIVETAFDNGITCFDLANNYGPPYGSAEETFGRIYHASLRPHRDEIIVTTKAGHDMWPGPYGEWGSRKNLMASLDQSLRRMRLDYVDIFYSHRPDPQTPLEETMQTLVDIVRQGKALYVGISKYPPEMAARAYAYLKEAHVPCLVYQGRYNMLERGGGRRLRGLLAAGARPADRPLSQRHPGGFPDAPQQVPQRERADAGAPHAAPRVERRSEGRGLHAGAIRPALDPPPPGGRFRDRRSEQRGAAEEQPAGHPQIARFRKRLIAGIL